MPSKTPQLFVFGKAPEYSDFVCRGLEQHGWVQGIFEDFTLRAHDSQLADWYDVQALPRFGWAEKPILLRRKKFAFLTMAPSQDRHGRRFPLAMGLTAVSPPYQRSLADFPTMHDALRAQLRAWGLSSASAMLDALLHPAEADLDNLLPMTDHRLPGGILVRWRRQDFPGLPEVSRPKATATRSDLP